MSEFNERDNVNEKTEVELNEEYVNMNGFQKAIGIITSPKKTLLAISVKPSFLIPILLILIIPAAHFLFAWSGYEQMIIESLESTMATSGLEITDEFLSMQMNISKWTMVILATVVAIGGAAISALYYFVAAKIAKSDVGYSRLFSTRLHVAIIGLLSYIILTILVILGSPTQSYTSLVMVLPQSMQTTFIGGLLTPIEFFGIWGLIVMYYGMRIVAKVSKKAALISVIVALLISMLFTGASLGISSMMTGMMG